MSPGDSTTNPIERGIEPAACIGLAVGVVGALLYLVWDNWWVNWDGGFYLYIARSIWEGTGPSFPDGSPAVFRGPGYPTLFAVGWSVVDVSAKTAIWMSRGALLAGGAIVALVVARKASATGAVLAGLTVLVPALILESGGWYFVPDGLAAVFVVSSIAVTVWGRDSPRLTGGVLAGVLMAAAVLTKETALLFFPIVPVVIWSRAKRGGSDAVRAIGGYPVAMSVILASWLWWAASGTTILVPFPVSWSAVVLSVGAAAGGVLIVASERLSETFGRAQASIVGLVGLPSMMLVAALSLVLVAEPTVMSATEGLARLGDELAYFLGWAWLPAVVVIGLALSLARRISSRAAPLWVAGVLLLGVGFGQMWYSAAAALSLRNGVGAVIGLALVAGTSMWASHNKLLRSVMVVALGAFLIIAGLATARIDATRSARAQTWDNDAVRELRTWLAAASLDSVTITPFYANYLYFLEPSLPEPNLLDWHFMSTSESTSGEQSFCRQVWWAAELPECPRGSELRVVQGNRRVTGAVFAGGADHGRPLVVTGHTESDSAFNGDGLLFLIEKFNLGRPVFATSETNLPHWAVVYDLDWDRWNSESLPAAVQSDLTGFDELTDETIPIDRDEFLTLLHGVLSP